MWELRFPNYTPSPAGRCLNASETLELRSVISTHPQIIILTPKSWLQTYLDDINPLLKVTHTPSLQGRIIEAASNVTNIDPNLEALMFSIYSMAITVVDDCQAIFGSSKEDLLTRFQFGCQQALLNSKFLQSSDRDCLTALYLYLVSLSGGRVVMFTLTNNFSSQFALE